MSSSSIFTLITNDGLQDRMLMATAFLNARLRAINEYKTRTNGGNETSEKNIPTLLDIEKTHILFTNAHFKPFAALAFEYNKVIPNSGSPALGQEIQFSIPQFGDFFHDIVCHIILDQPTMIIDANTLPSDEPLMRWCNYPGERILRRVRMDVNGNPLDEYTYHVNTMHREYRVAPNKIVGWNRDVGQEEPKLGFVDQPNWVGSGIGADAIVHRQRAEIFTGNQTPSGQKVGQLELFVPFLFWFNKDVRLAVPSVAIPYGQRFITVNLAPFDELVALYPRGAGTYAAPNGSFANQAILRTVNLYINNIFVHPEVHQIYIRRVGFSLIRVHREQRFGVSSPSKELLLNQLKWPIEYMYVGMKIRNYFDNSDAALMRESMDRWNIFHQVVNDAYEVQGQTVRREVTLMVVPDAGDPATTLGILITSGIGSGDAVTAVGLIVGDVVRIDNILYNVTGVATPGLVGEIPANLVFAPGPLAAVVATEAIALTATKVLDTGFTMTAPTVIPTVDVLSLKAHGVTMYNAFPARFFNAYTAYHFGGPNINTPTDPGLMFIPFCQYPGTYQPSGHFNVSRAREFYIEYVSSVITTSNEGVLVIVASALNFLLISDGSAVLRYST